MKSRENIIPGIITATIGNSRLPVSAASCKNGDIIMAALVNIIMDDRQRNRRRLLKGIHDLATAARLIKPTERYIKRLHCNSFMLSAGLIRRNTRQQANMAMLSGNALVIAFRKKVPSTLRSFFSKDIKSAGKASITASINVI